MFEDEALGGGYVFAMGDCYSCGDLFTFNPYLVPSVRDENGARQPLCRACIERANPIRRERGLPEIVPIPGAYEPGSE